MSKVLREPDQKDKNFFEVFYFTIFLNSRLVLVSSCRSFFLLTPLCLIYVQQSHLLCERMGQLSSIRSSQDVSEPDGTGKPAEPKCNTSWTIADAKCEECLLMLSLRSIKMLMLQFILTVPVNTMNTQKIPKLDTYINGRLKAAFWIDFFKVSVQTCSIALALTRMRAGCHELQEMRSVRTLNQSARLLYSAPSLSRVPR